MFKRSPYSDRYIDISFLIIAIFGIVMIGSASVGEPFYETITETGESISAMSSTWWFAIQNMGKQIVFVFSGWLLMTFLRNKFNYKKINMHFIHFVYIAILVMMLACLAFDPVNGAQAWLRFPGFTIQPAEFAKLVCIILLGYYLTEVPDAMRISNNLSNSVKEELKKRRFTKAFLEPLIMCFVIIFVCLFLQNDFGTAAIIGVICVVCFFCANNRYYRYLQKQLWLAVLAVVAAVAVAAPILVKVLKPYQIARITSWLDPLNSEYVLGASYQLVNGMIAIANHGLLGAGLGNSTQKFGYIPEAYNDFISAIIFEELGVFGLALIVVPYTIIIVRLFNYAFKMEDSFSKITLCGIGTYFFMHLFLNLGGVSGLIPMTGIPLLCISAGGSSTWAAFAAIGIAQAIIKRHNRSQQA